MDDTPIKSMKDSTSLELHIITKNIEFPVYAGQHASIPIGGGIVTEAKYVWSSSFNETECIEHYRHLDPLNTISWINTDTQLTEALAKYRLDTSKFMCTLPMRLSVSAKSPKLLYYATVTSLGKPCRMSSHDKAYLIENCAVKKRLPFTRTIAVCGVLCLVGSGVCWMQDMRESRRRAELWVSYAKGDYYKN